MRFIFIWRMLHVADEFRFNILENDAVLNRISYPIYKACCLLCPSVVWFCITVARTKLAASSILSDGRLYNYSYLCRVCVDFFMHFINFFLLHYTWMGWVLDQKSMPKITALLKHQTNKKIQMKKENRNTNFTNSESQLKIYRAHTFIDKSMNGDTQAVRHRFAPLFTTIHFCYRFVYSAGMMQSVNYLLHSKWMHTIWITNFTIISILIQLFA